jgi:hypothetical protein
MTESITTPFSSQAEILADLWLNYKQDEEFQDFIEYNDLGLPLAYAISNDIVKNTDVAERFVGETFSLLLAALEITEDTGFETLDDIFAQSSGDEPYTEEK